jgi:hypothetical protein
MSTSVRSRSDSGFEEAASGEVSYSTMDASLSVTGQRKATHTHGCPLCGDLHLLTRCLKFLCKVPIQRWSFCKSERLCLKCFGRNHLSKHCHHNSCSDCGGPHHSLLHRVGCRGAACTDGEGYHEQSRFPTNFGNFLHASGKSRT